MLWNAIYRLHPATHVVHLPRHFEEYFLFTQWTWRFEDLVNSVVKSQTILYLILHWSPRKFHLFGRRQELACTQGRIQDFFLGGGALVSCFTSTSINHIVFFFCRIPVVLENRRSSRVGGGGAHPLHPPPDPPLCTRILVDCIACGACG